MQLKKARCERPTSESIPRYPSITLLLFVPERGVPRGHPSSALFLLDPGSILFAGFRGRRQEAAFGSLLMTAGVQANRTPRLSVRGASGQPPFGQIARAEVFPCPAGRPTPGAIPRRQYGHGTYSEEGERGARGLACQVGPAARCGPASAGFLAQNVPKIVSHQTSSLWMNPASRSHFSQVCWGTGA